jgi:hypothetical protein
MTKHSVEHTERRIKERRADWCNGVCSQHEVIQNGTKEHRQIVCAKIAEVKVDMEKKANHSDLRGLMRLISILITICCLIIAGQAIWLKSDISGVTSSIQRLNVRITETVNDRVASDVLQLQKLGTIEGQLSTINWRLTELEAQHKPENKGGKIN